MPDFWLVGKGDKTQFFPALDAKILCPTKRINLNLAVSNTYHVVLNGVNDDKKASLAS